MARRGSRFTANVVDSDRIIRLWLLRILVLLGEQREFARANVFSNDAVAEAIGLGH